MDNTIRRGRTLANDNDMPYYVISAKQEGDIEVYKLFEKAVSFYVVTKLAIHNYHYHMTVATKLYL